LEQLQMHILWKLLLLLLLPTSGAAAAHSALPCECSCIPPTPQSPEHPLTCPQSIHHGLSVVEAKPVDAVHHDRPTILKHLVA
jgi:hypothetical protein